MKYQARVEVRLKSIHSDPEGETTRRSLGELGYPVEEVRVGKVYDIRLEGESSIDAERMVEEMSRRLLANPVKDDYVFNVSEFE
jgi:phosphoribosylformylglycinamidine synthase PurS subunit